MKLLKISVFLSTVLIIAFSANTFSQEIDFDNETAFQVFLSEFRVEAIEAGIRPETLDAVLPNITLTRQAIVADRAQPEFTNTYARYIERVSPWRIENGRKLLEEHGDMIRKVAAEHGVQARFIASILGVETNYGTYELTLSVFDVVATLAYDRRRSALFREQLLSNFEILDKGYASLENMKSSWAGALGYPQFSASSYLNLAIDQDGDGQRDLWSMGPDVIGSVANYLKDTGWREDQTWGREVRLPPGGEVSLLGEQGDGLTPDPTCRRYTAMGIWRNISDWQDLGVRKLDGSDLPTRNLPAALIMGDKGDDKAYLVYRNTCSIMHYNPALRYAVTIGLLSDEIAEISNN